MDYAHSVKESSGHFSGIRGDFCTFACNTHICETKGPGLPTYSKSPFSSALLNCVKLQVQKIVDTASICQKTVGPNIDENAALLSYSVTFFTVADFQHNCWGSLNY